MSLNFRLRVLDFEGKLVQETPGNIELVHMIIYELIRPARHDKAAPVITIQLKEYAQLSLYHEILRINGPEAAPGTVNLSVGNKEDGKYIVEPWNSTVSSFSLSYSFPQPQASNNMTSDAQSANQTGTNGLSYGDYLLLASASRNADAGLASTEAGMGGIGGLEEAKVVAGVEAEVEGQPADNDDGREQEAQQLKVKVKEKRSCQSMP